MRAINRFCRNLWVKVVEDAATVPWEISKIQTDRFLQFFTEMAIFSFHPCQNEITTGEGE
jgi:dTDP-4-amino-4,6-dideoxygalactose transaminase